MWTLLSGLPGPGCVQRGGFLFKEFWTRIVFWPDTCLVELTKSYVKFQSLVFISKVLCSVPKVLCSVPKVLYSIPKSYVKVAKFSSSVFL